MTKKRIVMFFVVLLLFSFCTFAQTQSETRNLRVYYDVVNERTGLILRSSTVIVTISIPVIYDKIIRAARDILGFNSRNQRYIDNVWHDLILKDYVIIE